MDLKQKQENTSLQKLKPETSDGYSSAPKHTDLQYPKKREKRPPSTHPEKPIINS